MFSTPRQEGEGVHPDTAMPVSGMSPICPASNSRLDFEALKQSSAKLLEHIDSLLWMKGLRPSLLAMRQIVGDEAMALCDETRQPLTNLKDRSLRRDYAVVEAAVSPILHLLGAAFYFIATQVNLRFGWRSNASVGRERLTAPQEFAQTRGTVELQDGARVIPRAYVLSPGDFIPKLANLYEDANLEFLRYYGQVSRDGNPHLVKFLNAESMMRLCARKNARASNYIYDLLQKLSGNNAGVLTEVCSAFGHRIPVILEQRELRVQSSEVNVYDRVNRIRVPFGSLKRDRNRMLDLQGELSRGVYAKASIEIFGRIDRDFLKWAFGDGPMQPSPIPGIEIIMALPLPSGGVYRFVLKESERPSQRPENDVKSLDDTDQEFIYHLGQYFLDARNKTEWSLLCDLLKERFPPEVKSLCDNAAEISDLTMLRKFISAWRESLFTELSEVRSSTAEKQLELDWRNPLFRDPTYLREKMAQRLDVIPVTQQFRGPEYFQLSHNEREYFLNRYASILSSIFDSECNRIADELSTSNAAQVERVRRGYRGDRGGIPLNLDFAIMDCIVDFRRRQQYQREVAPRRKLAGDEASIPPEVGRRFDLPERFFGPEEVREHLENSKGVSQVTVTVNDPLSGRRTEVKEADDMPKFIRTYYQENLRRLEEVADVRIKEMWERNRALPERGFIKHQLDLLEGELAAMRELREEHAELVARKNCELAARQAELTPERATPMQRKEALASLRNAHDQLISAMDNKIALAERRLLETFKGIFPDDVQDLCVQIESVVDQEVTRFIFAVGADGKPILDQEHFENGHRICACHSELLGGKNMYAGGEIIFCRHQEILANFDAWLKFRQRASTSKDSPVQPWYLLEINNLSGHYWPSSETLPYAESVILEKLDPSLFAQGRHRLMDRLAPGMRLAGAGVYRF